MKTTFTRQPIGEGVYFSSVTDGKFKRNQISVSLVVDLERSSVTNRAIVPFLLRKGCRSCPDFTKLNQKLCQLYGAFLSCDVSKFGAAQVLDVAISGVDDRFTLDKAPMVAQCAQLLADVLLEPNLVDGVFPQKDVALERQQIIDTIESQINDKRSYAMSRCCSIMCEGESLAIEKYGYIEDAEKITPESAAAAYRQLLETAQIEIMFVGCGDPAIAKEIFTKAFAGVSRHPAPLPKVETALEASKVKEVTDQLDVAQSKLVLGFRTGGTSSPRELMALRLMVALYGGTPNSRLFMYVREKLSLCYYCAARVDRLTGLMYVDSGVEKANKQKAYDEILRQLQVVREGGFTDEELEATRLIMKTSLGRIGDVQGLINEWYMAQIIAGTCVSPEEELELVDQVTREEIIQAANKVTLDTVYFLTGKEAE